MKLFKKLFAEKLLRFYEGTNAGIRYMGMIPGIKNHIKEETFAENSKARLAVGIFAQLFMVLWEFIKKFLYVFALIYIPYRIISFECPLIKRTRNLLSYICLPCLLLYAEVLQTIYCLRLVTGIIL